MRRAGFLAIASVVAGCALLSGAADLVVGTPPPDGEASPDATADAPVPLDASEDAGEPPRCDEPGLVARWKLDEGAGTVVHDCTSRRLDGTLAGAAAWIAGIHGMAVDLDGGHLDFGDPAALRLTGPLTAAIWVRMRNDGNTTQYFVGRRTRVASGWRISREIDQYGFVIQGDAGSGSVDTGSIVFDTWVHVAGVFRPGAAVELYLDGQLSLGDTSAVPAAIFVEADPFYVGVRGDGLFGLRGSVDDVRIYDRALDAAEIATLAQR
jgi:hypothetical protein